MGVTVLTCYRLDCDTCGTSLICEGFEGDEYTPHHASADEALSLLWGDPDVDRTVEDHPRPLLHGQRQPDGQIWCHPCVTRHRCATEGHAWWGWEDCGAPNPATGVCDIRRHRGRPCPQHRWCVRGNCNAKEERPAVVAA